MCSMGHCGSLLPRPGLTGAASFLLLQSTLLGFCSVWNVGQPILHKGAVFCILKAQWAFGSVSCFSQRGTCAQSQDSGYRADFPELKI